MNNSENSRRSFLKNAVAGTSILATTNPFALEAKDLPFGETPDSNLPWFKRVTRWGQINITEKDPAQYDIPWWRSFWKETNTEGIVVNAGGIVAYYPTKIPLHRKAEFLGGRDLFGDINKAAKEDGVVVFARMDSNRAHEEFYQAHPDWFAIDAAGNPYKAADLYIACINSPYYQQHIPAILTEIAQLYKPAGFTDNSWSGLGRESICYCVYCKRSFRDKTGQNIPEKKERKGKNAEQRTRRNSGQHLETWDLN
ncbi:MAG: beta-galactosidase, partial [Segetibacter sp.]